LVKLISNALTHLVIHETIAALLSLITLKTDQRHRCSSVETHYKLEEVEVLMIVKCLSLFPIRNLDKDKTTILLSAKKFYHITHLKDFGEPYQKTHC